MSSYEQKVVQYLEEAHATEVALIRVLQSQVAMTRKGSTRAAIEQHLDETRSHAERVRSRIGELQSTGRGNPLQAWLGLTEAVVGQALALGKAPLDLVRGTSGEEKVLKNAKDDCATEAFEIATYTAIERLARRAGDRETAELAASILADERRMLDRLLGEEIPKLTDAVAGAELEGRGAVDATAGAARSARAAKPTARRQRSPGSRSATAGGGRGRRAGRQPWDGYDDQDVAAVRAALDDADAATLRRVRDYERSHKARTGVLEATEREPAGARS